jgi:hypothetical protein
MDMISVRWISKSCVKICCTKFKAFINSKTTAVYKEGYFVSGFIIANGCRIESPIIEYGKCCPFCGKKMILRNNDGNG